MARRKPAEQGEDPNNQLEQQGQLAEGELPADAATPDAPAGHKSAWLAKFPGWSDVEAGVYLTEDRQNRRMTIKFDEKPSEPVRNFIKKEHDWRFDGEDQLWYKGISQAKPRQSRQEAEDVAFQVAKMIREEKGLEPKKAFALGM